jgi:hypothetical protein
MRKGFWRHERFMDVVMEVLKCGYKDHKRVKVRVMWWNRGQSGKAFPLYIVKSYTIALPLDKWNYLGPTPECQDLDIKNFYQDLARSKLNSYC